MEREAEENCNTRQIAFCRAVVYDGISHEEAYRAAGYDGGNATSSSQRLLKSKNVGALYAVYMEGLRRTALLSAGNLQMAAAEVLDRALADDDRNTALKAIDQLTKMRGQYAPTKNEVSVKEEKPLPQMDQDTLRELFKAKRLVAVGDEG